MTGVRRIEAERARQIDVEGYTDASDDEYQDELVYAALAYINANEQLDVDIPKKIRALKESRDALLGPEYVAARREIGAALTDIQDHPEKFIRPQSWPWFQDHFKPSIDPIRNLEKAGALIAAEIDRRLRAAAKTGA